MYIHACTCSIVAESPIAGQQPSLTGATQQSTVMTGAGGGGGGTKLESGSGSSLKSGQSAADNNNNKATNEGSQEPQEGSASTMPSGSGGGGGEESTASIFLQTAAYLLDVHALKVLYFAWCSYDIMMWGAKCVKNTHKCCICISPSDI